jgi:cellulose synthase operon protein C
MNNHRFPHRHTLSATLAGLLLLGACGAEDPQKMLASARDYQAKNDHAAAIIQLKNALQQAPELAEARYRLGLALSNTGDWPGAESELEKARDAGYPMEEVAPLLARARLAQGQFKKVSNEFAQLKLSNAQAQAELKTAVAVAWRQQGDDKASQAALKEALEAVPEHAPARIEQARGLAADQQFDAALATLDALLEKTPEQADALKLKGDLLASGMGDLDKALLAYRAALVAQPTLLEARVGLVRSLLQQGQLDAAGEELGPLVKAAGGHPHTLYLQAQLAAQKGDYNGARPHAQQLMKLTPDNAAALELNGVIEYGLDSLVNAEASLSRAVQISPQLGTARRALLLTYLKTGQVDKALGALPVDLDSRDDDPALVALAGQVYMVKGDPERAEHLFARAARLDPNDPAKRTSLAMSQLASGKTDMALNSLKDISASDSGTGADLALINSHMRKGETARALAAIDALEKKRPNDPLTHQLRGRAKLLSKDREGARKAFEQALAAEPDYFAATAALAAVDMLDGKPQDARQRLDALVARNPKHAQALMALAELSARQGAQPQEIAAQIRKAVDAAPADKAPRLMLVEHYLRQNDAKGALTEASAAAAALPEVPEVLDALGRSQLANGEINQAVGSFNKLAGQMPRSPLPYLRLASVHVTNKDRVSALQSLRKALDVQPRLVPAQRGMIDLYLADDQTDKALALSREIQKERPKEAVGHVLEGDILARSKEWSRAAQAYRTGLSLEALPEPAIKLHTALSQAGKPADAERVLVDWVKGHPNDPAVPLHLGIQAIAAEKLKDAQRHFEKVLALQPNNAIALNNLAWVAGRLGRADAVSLAERANELAPDQPPFMDTLAMLLSERNEHQRALELQNRAVSKAPADPSLKLNLARILLKSGDVGAARPLLAELSTLGDRFPDQDKVQSLQKQLP